MQFLRYTFASPIEFDITFGTNFFLYLECNCILNQRIICSSLFLTLNELLFDSKDVYTIQKILINSRDDYNIEKFEIAYYLQSVCLDRQGVGVLHPLPSPSRSLNKASMRMARPSTHLALLQTTCCHTETRLELPTAKHS